MLANIIFIDILYDYRDLFEVYPFNNKQLKKAIKTPQRFEICNALVDSLLSLPARALFTRRYFPSNFKTAAENLMKSAFSFFSHKYEKARKPINLIAGYPSDSIEDSFLDKIYQNLSLSGNESLVESYQQLWKFQRFIKFLELSRKDFETLKIALIDGDDIFSCPLIVQKHLCENSVKWSEVQNRKNNFSWFQTVQPQRFNILSFILTEAPSTTMRMLFQKYLPRSVQSWAFIGKK